jgi:hypothetical protein
VRRWLAAAALAGGAGTLAAAAPALASAPALALTLTLTLTLTDDQPVMPEPYRRASEALTGLLFPEARRDWTTGDLIWPDGRLQKLSLTGLTWAARDGGFWLASGVEFPEAFDEQVRRLTALERPSERQALRLVVARADAEFRILDHRVFEPDSESPLSRLVGVTLVRFPAGPAAAGGWPRLRVRGASGALVGGGAGLVWWEGEFEVTSMSWSTRGPSAFWRKEADGRETRDDLAAAGAGDGTAPGRVTLQGLRSGSVFAFPCGRPCDVSPYAALEAAAAAAKPPPARSPRP